MFLHLYFVRWRCQIWFHLELLVKHVYMWSNYSAYNLKHLYLNNKSNSWTRDSFKKAFFDNNYAKIQI